MCVQNKERFLLVKFPELKEIEFDIEMALFYLYPVFPSVNDGVTAYSVGGHQDA